MSKSTFEQLLPYTITLSIKYGIFDCYYILFLLKLKYGTALTLNLSSTWTSHHFFLLHLYRYLPSLRTEFVVRE